MCCVSRHIAQAGQGPTCGGEMLRTMLVQGQVVYMITVMLESEVVLNTFCGFQ